MFCLNDTMRYHLCPGCTDMRKGINSLIGVVKEKMCANIRNGDVFIFIGHSHRLMKLLLLRTNTILRAICNVTVFQAIQPCISRDLA